MPLYGHHAKAPGAPTGSHMILPTSPPSPMQSQAVAAPARDSRPPVPGLACESVLGIPLALAQYDDVMDWMDAIVRTGQRVSISAAAVHLVMVAREDPETHEALLNTLTVPDGQPLVWALRALGHRQASRIYGPELMARYCERAAASGVRMFLYGGRNQGALVQLVLTLRQRYPGLNIAGGYSPPFRPQTDDEREAIAAEINASRADVVWVGIGQPKQEKWMAEMRDLLDAPILAGVGAAFDFHAGLVPQAPSWMQETGLEWTYRLAHEPRRLWRRYARYNPRFIAGFAGQYARHRMRAVLADR
jgi:N-acetylglucosaminyldiphosphoundecaprenol N-acetyl-beta-D-mannosaminyltransferase